MDFQEKQEVEKADKALISFGSGFLDKIDRTWRTQNFRNRSEYINHLVRKDMEQHGSFQQSTVSEQI